MIFFLLDIGFLDSPIQMQLGRNVVSYGIWLLFGGYSHCLQLYARRVRHLGFSTILYTESSLIIFENQFRFRSVGFWRTGKVSVGYDCKFSF